ncbi:MAG: DUF4197 domain-containing protein [Arcobacter sp.]|nr:DUF4197 domain-containing protein [Arcobacter sp.]
MKKISIISSLILCSTLSFGFDLGSIAKSVMDNVLNEPTTKTSTSTSKKSLNNTTVSNGLKEALKVGVDFAVKNLGKNNGYLNNEIVKIPLPENLQKAEGLIRNFGGDKIANDLINSMNTAATKAAPKTAKIFINAIEKMSLEDAQTILSGNENAATTYFKNNTTSSLKKLITPIIQQTMKQNQVASYYDAFNNYYKQYGKDLVENSSVNVLAKSFGVDSYLPGTSDQTLDEYVTDKAIYGLFKMISKKEAEIRSNPIEQTTSLLKKVFGK